MNDAPRIAVQALNHQLACRARCTSKCPYYLDCPLVGSADPDAAGDRTCALADRPLEERVRFLNLSRADDSGTAAEIAKTIWLLGQRVGEKPTAANLSAYADLLIRFHRVRFPPIARVAAPLPEKKTDLTITVTEASAPARTVTIPGVGTIEVIEESADPESLFYSGGDEFGDDNAQHD